MTPCPSRQAEYEAFIERRPCGSFVAHLAICGRCQTAFENDPRLDVLLRLVGVELGRYPMATNVWEEE